MYKLSPSDFRYLWNDCKHCYYQKVKYNIALPSIGLPGVFSKMNGMLQSLIQGKNLRDINSDLPDGIIEVKEGFLRSKPLPHRNDCFISGRFDILSKLSDGTYAVIDFKITDPKEDKATKFANQLHAYKFALENPDSGAAKKISRMGLITISPENIHLDTGKVLFTAAPQWYGVEEDMAGFFNSIDQVSVLLNGPTPQPTASCNWCKYRLCFAETPDKKETFQTDLPF